MTSPRLMPIRNSSRRSAGSSALRAASSSWISTAQRTASAAREFGKHAVASGADDPTVVAFDQRVHLLPVRAERAQRAFLVGRHETAVALHVGAEDGRELALDAGRSSRLLLRTCAMSPPTRSVGLRGGLASQLTARG